jgi:hypothetical protein
MANRNLTVEKAEAKKLYLRGIKSPVMLAKILELPRQTVAAWIEREAWAKIPDTDSVTAFDVAKEYILVLHKIVTEVKEKRANGEAISMMTLKEADKLASIIRKLDEDYDVRGSLIHWSNKFINCVSALPEEILPKGERKAFVAALQRTMPHFLKSQDQ